MIEKNKFTRAEYLIYKYTDDGFIQLRWLNYDALTEAVNLPHHDLSEDELVTLLYSLFDERYLVAETKATGYFTPTLDQIKSGLNEPGFNDDDWNPDKVTFYGYVSSALSRYNELAEVYGANKAT